MCPAGGEKMRKRMIVLRESAIFFLDCENELWVTTFSDIFDIWFLETDQRVSIITGFPHV